MNEDNITKIIVESIKKIQEISGDEFEELPLDSVPRDILTGFDSLREEEATIVICQNLGQKLNASVKPIDNLFYYKGKASNVKQVINKIKKELGDINE